MMNHQPVAPSNLTGQIKIKIVIWALTILTANGCSTHRGAIEGPGDLFERRSIAIMTVETIEDAELLRKALLRGGQRPDSTKTIPLNKLEQVNPSLSKIAVRLAECEISLPIPTISSPGYVVLQRGSAADCLRKEPDPTLSNGFQRVSDTAGQILIGLLVIGAAVFSIIAPFIFW